MTRTMPWGIEVSCLSLESAPEHQHADIVNPLVKAGADGRPALMKASFDGDQNAIIAVQENLLVQANLL